jgi:hypothetical protein
MRAWARKTRPKKIIRLPMILGIFRFVDSETRPPSR